jgi:hypothetical protein
MFTLNPEGEPATDGSEPVESYWVLTLTNFWLSVLDA